ncbi:MAG: glycosyltransferase family 2 protein [Solirubrobacteraceae bacterium MAG38_C4-C5]|nr:glycosyltransferase family 2 protein [Candidatus Siliceabacter maunaloa]
MTQVSVVIPTLDRWPLLSRALGSALAQQDVDLEVLVVDDGSTDGTEERVRALRDDRVSLIRHDAPMGVATARNDGIDRARGEWVAFLDDDDLWAPSKLSRQIEIAAARHAGWAWTGAIVVDQWLRPIRTVPGAPADGVAQRLLTNCVIAGPSAVIARTDLLRELDGFDPQLSAMADWDLWIRLAATAPGAACSPLLTAYVEHDTNMLGGGSDAGLQRPEFERLAGKHVAAATACDVEFGWRWWIHWVASRHRLAGRRTAAARAYLGSLRHGDPRGLGYAAGALAGDRAWQAVRSRVHGAPRTPDWLSSYQST